ncbi:hypothetical protein [Lysinibacter cavernae]|uniref:Uncharacterized protein n=1 Tax=Lysinibacter cavernae TaxID=1640652 RepID=A0A7X5QYD6_9MICO|nr:hypothetical protein [Lysinibacter cavernae]NIH52289.1 hypothetical protein [Lysinibacter cavernae]
MERLQVAGNIVGKPGRPARNSVAGPRSSRPHIRWQIKTELPTTSLAN